MKTYFKENSLLNLNYMKYTITMKIQCMVIIITPKLKKKSECFGEVYKTIRN